MILFAGEISPNGFVSIFNASSNQMNSYVKIYNAETHSDVI